MNYRDELLKKNLSHKTLKDYIAANKQFFNWCIAHELITIDPFTVVKLSSSQRRTTKQHRSNANAGNYMS